MQRYTVTIAPDDPCAAHTVVRLEIDSGAPRITELMLRAGDQAELAASDLPAIDFDLLLRAIGPATGAELVAPQGSSAPPPATTTRARRGKTPTAGRKRRGAADPAVTHAAGSTAEPSAAEPPADKPSANRRAPQRVYRTMPDEFLTRYGRDTMAQLAEVYDVPMHTIKAWIHTARKQGKLPPSRLRRRG